MLSIFCFCTHSTLPHVSLDLAKDALGLDSVLTKLHLAGGLHIREGGGQTDQSWVKTGETSENREKTGQLTAEARILPPSQSHLANPSSSVLII